MTWSSQQRQRLTAERKILIRYFPEARWVDPQDASRTRVEIDMPTNARNRYRLRLIVPSDYPSSQPDLLVVEPSPLRGRGFDLLETNGRMHTLTPLYAHPQSVRVCHYRGWDPNKTLYLVFMKGRLWLEAYEAHLRTGNPIDDYLGHM